MPSRRSLLATILGGLVAAGLAVLTALRVDLWRYVEFTDPVPLLVENYGTDPETVAVRITAEDGSTVFEETYDVPASGGRPDVTRITEEAVVEDVGRYRVVGELADGTTDDYVLEPLDTPVWGTNMPTLIVSIEGEIGRLWVGGAGGKP